MMGAPVDPPTGIGAARPGRYPSVGAHCSLMLAFTTGDQLKLVIPPRGLSAAADNIRQNFERSVSLKIHRGVAHGFPNSEAHEHFSRDAGG